MRGWNTFVTLLLFMLLLVIGFFATSFEAANAQTKGAATATKDKTSEKPKNKRPATELPPAPRDFRSPNFLLHTDLPKEEAEDLLRRLIVSRPEANFSLSLEPGGSLLVILC